MAPEFTEEDLVPVEMPDLDVSDFSGSDGEEADVGEEEQEEAADGEMAGEEVTESKTAAATDPGKVASQKSSRQVIRDLDEKISKYKQFLERAKSKHFSAIRFVTPKPINHPSFVYCLIALIAGQRAKQLHAGQTLSPWIQSHQFDLVAGRFRNFTCCFGSFKLCCSCWSHIVNNVPALQSLTIT